MSNFFQQKIGGSLRIIKTKSERIHEADDMKEMAKDQVMKILVQLARLEFVKPILALNFIFYYTHIVSNLPSGAKA